MITIYQKRAGQREPTVSRVSQNRNQQPTNEKMLQGVFEKLMSCELSCGAEKRRPRRSVKKSRLTPTKKSPKDS